MAILAFLPYFLQYWCGAHLLPNCIIADMVKEKKISDNRRSMHISMVCKVYSTHLMTGQYSAVGHLIVYTPLILDRLACVNHKWHQWSSSTITVLCSLLCSLGLWCCHHFFDGILGNRRCWSSLDLHCWLVQWQCSRLESRYSVFLMLSHRENWHRRSVHTAAVILWW